MVSTKRRVDVWDPAARKGPDEQTQAGAQNPSVPRIGAASPYAVYDLVVFAGQRDPRDIGAVKLSVTVDMHNDIGTASESFTVRCNGSGSVSAIMWLDHDADSVQAQRDDLRRSVISGRVIDHDDLHHRGAGRDFSVDLGDEICDAVCFIECGCDDDEVRNAHVVGLPVVALARGEDCPVA